MKIAINGTSGFVGDELCDFLDQKGYKIIKIKREIYDDLDALSDILNDTDAVINLAGTNLAKMERSL